MPIPSDRLREIVVELLSRPGHEKVRSLLYVLLTDGLGAKSTDLDFERPVPEVRGRLDALLGRTVFEIKSDLRTESREAESRLPDYLSAREMETGHHFVGIITDGVDFAVHERHGEALRELQAFRPTAEDPGALVAWLDGAVVVQTELDPDPETVQRELGRGSLAYAVAHACIRDAWAEVSDHSESKLKRALWGQLMARAYGTPVDDDELFFQHTYLTVVAKTIATRVLTDDMPEPTALLAGTAFEQAAVAGAVEPDFFDWILATDAGPEVVSRIALQTARFDLHEIHTDILKGLYESLIDPAQRRLLGEYYTPDWLASRVCERAIDNPLEQRVLDPACGSGTFLFHALRRLLDAADHAGMPTSDAVALACHRVIGIDVHPVAVLIARVTYLLALGTARLSDRLPISIPVYMGDSLQWNTESMLADRDVLIEVPGEKTVLHFPFSVTRDPGVFDSVIGHMITLSAQPSPDAPASDFVAWLQREHPDAVGQVEALANTYESIRRLRKEGKNHIWGFVARNQVRPVWLSSQEQRPDIVIGNPPWLAFRYMDAATQERFREECQQRNLWVGGKVATHQDLSAYFYAMCVELYLKHEGRIAFVMPYAALTRKQFEPFRTGWFGRRRGRRRQQAIATVRFDEVWTFDETVQPLFPVPSCVMIGTRSLNAPLPRTVTAFSGTLPRRDATPEEAAVALDVEEMPWPAQGSEGASPYKRQFRQGATVVPRMMFLVERVSRGGVLGSSAGAPLVRSRRTKQEKEPWKSFPSLEGNVEAEFLKPLYLGESIAPFRVLDPVTCVIPWDGGTKGILDAQEALSRGYEYLPEWLSRTEALWGNNRSDKNKMSLSEQLDYYGKLTAQFPISDLRVVYSKAGTLPAAAVLRDIRGVADHTLYWMAASSPEEGRYLVAILGSETARQRVAELQAKGQWGARHFDKLMLDLPIPRFNPQRSRHQQLAELAERAENIAAAVPLKEGMYFATARRQIRGALREDGVAGEMEEAVAELLGRRRMDRPISDEPTSCSV